MNYDPINTVVTLVTGFFLFFLLKSVLPAYFSEKGKNLATKEDIGKITEEVEKIKDAFTTKADQFRTDLQYFNHVRFSMKSEERNAIISVNEKYQLLLNKLTNINYVSFINTGVDGVIKLEQSLEDAYNEFIVSGAKMGLYIIDKDFIEVFNELKINIIELHHHILTVLAKAELTYAEFNEKVAKLDPSDLTSIKMIMRASGDERYQIQVSSQEEVLRQMAIIAKIEGRFEIESLHRLRDLASQVTRD